MIFTAEYGYTELEYLQNEYTSAVAAGAQGQQFTAIINAANAAAAQASAFIVDRPNAIGAQTSSAIEAAKRAVGAQLVASLAKVLSNGASANVIIQDDVFIDAQVEATIRAVNGQGSNFSANISGYGNAGAQFQAISVGPTQQSGAQVNAINSKSYSLGADFLGNLETESWAACQFNSIPNQKMEVGAQAEAFIVDTDVGLGARFISTSIFHSLYPNGIYAVHDYGVDPYLAPWKYAQARCQFTAIITSPTIPGEAAQYRGFIDKRTPSEAQAQAVINKAKVYGAQSKTFILKNYGFGSQFTATISKDKGSDAQFKAIISNRVGTGSQFVSVIGTPFAAQFRSVLYNTTQLRILWEFPSRGDGTGWTASHTATGDFNANNLNNDVVESVWRSPNGIKTGIRLDCDTGLNQGVFTDTIAILNHNLTRSANISIIGANDSAFASPGVVITMQPVEQGNAYYIAPTLPLNGYRYWRFNIDDVTNQNAFLSIGTIIFGSATILSLQESFSNPLRLSKTHYKDTVQTEGFTSVSNDRGVKKKISLDFNSMAINGGNFTNIQNILNNIATSHKALWIPVPTYPSRYAVFGKLSQLPNEEHLDNGENKDYVTFSVEVDEAL